MKKILLLLLTLTASVSLLAQSKPLTIGDKMVAVPSQKAFGFPGATVNFANYKGKALLLDFWSTHCAACVTLFPYLEKLQNKYGKDLQIVSVSPEDIQTVSVFAKRLKNVKQVNIASIVGDKQLNQLFPHATEPHMVWIGKDGFVKAITDNADVTEDNLRKLINGEKLYLGLKSELTEVSVASQPVAANTAVQDANPRAALFKLAFDNLDNPRIPSYSLLLDGKFNTNGSAGFNKSGIFAAKFALPGLFGLAYSHDSVNHKVDIMRFRPEEFKIRYITKDSTRFEFYSGKIRQIKDRDSMDRAYEIWHNEPGHAYNYIAKLPPAYPMPPKPTPNVSVDDPIRVAFNKWQYDYEAALCDKMKSDLNKSFPWISAKIVNETADVYVLRTIIPGDVSAIRSKGKGEAKVERTPYYLVANNVPMERFITELWFNFQKQVPRIENRVNTSEQGISTLLMVDIDLQTDMFNFDKVNEALKKYGLVLTKERKSNEVLVLTDTRSQAEIDQYYKDLAKQTETSKIQ